jgi:hypothetical protein
MNVDEVGKKGLEDSCSVRFQHSEGANTGSGMHCNNTPRSWQVELALNMMTTK